MCDDDAIRELKQEITTAHAAGNLSPEELASMYSVMWDLCPNTTKISTQDSSVYQCTCCGKLFDRNGGV